MSKTTISECLFSEGFQSIYCRWIISPHCSSKADCRHFYFKGEVLRDRINTSWTGHLADLWLLQLRFSGLWALNSWFSYSLFFTNLPNILSPLQRKPLASFAIRCICKKPKKPNKQNNNRPKPTKPKVGYLFFFLQHLRPSPLFKMNIFIFEIKPIEKMCNTYIYNLADGCEVYTL